MINQARSLLLNDLASNRPALGTFGEEYVPTEYRVLNYAGALQRVHDKLLGTAGDPLYQNYKLAQYMGIMHANQYAEELLLSLDTRYTYRPFAASFMNFDFSVEVEEIHDLGMVLTTVGEPVAAEAVGKALYRWTVQTAAGPTVLIKEAARPQWQTYPVTLVGTTVTPITLEGGITLQLSVPVGPWQVGAGWLVTAMARPSADLGTAILSLNSLGAKTVYTLLQDVPATMKNLWYEGVTLVDQLGGILGAFVYQAEKVRTNVGT